MLGSADADVIGRVVDDREGDEELSRDGFEGAAPGFGLLAGVVIATA